jgi:membrane protein DedA with SNARE-associated domain
MLLESSSLPIPSEVILPFAGYLVSKGQLDFFAALATATLAGVCGSLVDYYIGLKGTNALLEHKLLGRAFFSRSQLETVARGFNRYGGRIVLFSRLVPGFRTLVSFPAGAVKMKLPKFIALTTVGCLIWNTALIYVGVFLGSNWKIVAGYLHYVIIAAVVAVVAVGVWYYLRRRQRRKRALAAIPTVVKWMSGNLLKAIVPHRLTAMPKIMRSLWYQRRFSPMP